MKEEDSFNQPLDPAQPALFQNWGVLISAAVIVLGLLILLINLPGHSVVAARQTIPLVIQDGLIVKGNGPELYVFKRYTLHRLLEPSAEQQRQARPMPDDFLSGYRQGEPLDRNGQPVASALVAKKFPVRQAAVKPPLQVPGLSFLALSLLGSVMGIIILLGALWLCRPAGNTRMPEAVPAGDYLQQAADYAGRIEQLLKARPGRQAHELLVQVRRWRVTVENLVKHISQLRQDELIWRDLARTPEIMAGLEQQLAAETNPSLRLQLEQALARRRSQLATLEQLQATISQAEIQVEATLALLGTLYSQLLAQQSTWQVSDYSALLRDIDEQVHRLQDYLGALEEVKTGKTRWL